MNRFPFQYIVLTVLALGAVSCATVEPASLVPTPRGTRIQFLAYGSADYTRVYGSDEVGKGVMVGTASGAMAGAGAGFVGGLECGPFFVVCSPVGAILGAGAGAIFGGVVGGIDTGRTSLPKAKAGAFNELLSRTFFEFDPAHSLRDHVVSRARGAFDIVEDSPRLRVVLRVEELRFEQHANDRLTLHMSGSMRVYYGLREEDRTKLLVFTHASETLSVDEWMADDGASLTREVDSSLDAIASQMVSVLEHPPGRAGPTILKPAEPDA